MSSYLWTYLSRQMWNLSVRCGLDRESQMNWAKVRVTTFFFFLLETGKMLQCFLKLTSPKKQPPSVTRAHGCLVTLLSKTPCLFLRNVLLPNDPCGGCEEGLKEEPHSLCGQRCVPHASVRANSCLRRLEMHPNYFQKVWALQHSESIFHLL